MNNKQQMVIISFFLIVTFIMGFVLDYVMRPKTLTRSQLHDWYVNETLSILENTDGNPIYSIYPEDKTVSLSQLHDAEVEFKQEQKENKMRKNLKLENLQTFYESLDRKFD